MQTQKKMKPTPLEWSRGYSPNILRIHPVGEPGKFFAGVVDVDYEDRAEMASLFCAAPDMKEILTRAMPLLLEAADFWEATHAEGAANDCREVALMAESVIAKR